MILLTYLVQPSTTQIIPCLKYRIGGHMVFFPTKCAVEKGLEHRVVDHTVLL